MFEREIQSDFRHRVFFTRDAFASDNDVLRKILEEGRAEEKDQQVLVFVDAGVAESNKTIVSDIRRYFDDVPQGVRLAADAVILPGGEACKNDWELVTGIWREINERALCRHSYVVAVGGGAFLDLVGFAASTAHRGVRHVRMPTTTLSQGDGGVGVKNGVNFFGKKNWVGCFSVPFAIVNDFEFLNTLPDRERRAGLIEGIKVSLIRDREFYEFIEANADGLARLDAELIEQVVRRSAELHVEHIATGGDPFELGSARPLDFGHWVAHKLEQESGFSIGHGEAVAIGMAVDLIYSARIGLIEADDAERILALIEKIGFQLGSDYLAKTDDGGRLIILRGLEEFREHLGGELTITLVPEIGRKIEVHEMDESEIVEALGELQKRTATAGAMAVSGK